MLPEFGELFGEPIPAYFVMLAVGFAIATALAVRMAGPAGLDRDVFIDLGLVTVLAGVAGGRLLHVLADGYFWDYVHLCTDPAKVVWRTARSAAACESLGGLWQSDAGTCHPPGRDCWAWLAFWNGGLAYYGGFIAAVGAGAWFVRREGQPVWPTADVAGVVTPVGLALGRVGCWLAGCCFGAPTAMPWAVRFPAGSPASLAQATEGLIQHASLPSLPVHATQLYEAAGSLLIAVVLGLVIYPRRRFAGQTFLWSVWLYALLRFVVEFWRADERGGFWALSTSQWLALALAVLAAGLDPWLRKHMTPTAAATAP